MAMKDLALSRYDQRFDLFGSTQKSCDCMKGETSGVSESLYSIGTGNGQAAERANWHLPTKV